jgi:acyl-CoA dehydrogenase
MYQITGVKHYISNAPEADAAVVFARHDDGVGCFLVEGGLPATAQRVAGHSIGRLELRDTPARLVAARGFPLALGALERCRPTVGAAALGLARRAFDETCRHVSTREQFGAPLARLDVVRGRVAEMAVLLESAALACGHACWRRALEQRQNPFCLAACRQSARAVCRDRRVAHRRYAAGSHGQGGGAHAHG